MARCACRPSEPVSIRLTGGRWGGRAIGSPAGGGVRPTAARVREALFSVIGQDLDGYSVLDAFGGTGLLALEAASRGAGPVRIVERDPREAARIRANVQALGAEAVEVRVGDAARAVQDGRWDIIFLDPPYAEDGGAWAARAAPAAAVWLVVEHAAARPLPDVLEGLVRDRPRIYGDTALSVYRRAAEPSR